MADSKALIEAFREELFRWNRQINLVSRQDTEDRLDGLFGQCRGGFLSICESYFGDAASGGVLPELMYFDLGSGGGLPGVIWHVLFSHQIGASSGFSSVKTWLVEPREKRAWFLRRLNRIAEMPPFEVLHGRWGAVKVDEGGFSAEGGAAPVVLVSLKALHLNDLEVFSGLNAAFSTLPAAFRVIIARYYPPDQVFDSGLAALLKIPTANESRVDAGSRITSLGGRVCGLSGDGENQASLIFSEYLVEAVG